MGESLTYNQQDIERYLQQKMSAQEMHAFEKAMMDDPFLADAVDGYTLANTSIAEKHLTEIEKKIRGEKEEAKVVAMPKEKVQWKRIAAIFFVVMSGSILTYYVFNYQSNENYATKEIATVQGSMSNEISQDSIKPQEPALANNDAAKPELLQKANNYSPLQENSQKNIVEKQSEEAAKLSDDSKDMAANDMQTSDFKKSEIAQSAPSAMQEKEVEEKAMAKTIKAPVANQNEFRGKVTDDKGEPVPFASVKAQNGAAVSTDAKGNFALKSTDSTVKVDVSGVGYNLAKAELKNNSSGNKIMLKENTSALSEVVVTGLSTKKRVQYAGAATQITSDTKNLPSNAEPEGGWQNYKNYVKMQMDSLHIDTDDLANNQIDIEFSIDKQGYADRIKVKEKANKEVSEKAIQIIKKGPKWTKKSNDARVKLTIPF